MRLTDPPISITIAGGMRRRSERNKLMRRIVLLVMACAAGLTAAGSAEAATIRCSFNNGPTTFPAVGDVSAKNLSCATARSVMRSVQRGWARGGAAQPADRLPRTAYGRSASGRVLEFRCRYVAKQGYDNPYYRATCQSARHIVRASLGS